MPLFQKHHLPRHEAAPIGEPHEVDAGGHTVTRRVPAIPHNLVTPGLDISDNQRLHELPSDAVDAELDLRSAGRDGVGNRRHEVERMGGVLLEPAPVGDRLAVIRCRG